MGREQLAKHCRATALDLAPGAGAGLRDPQSTPDRARRDSRRKACIGNNSRPRERDACRRARRAPSSAAPLSNPHSARCNISAKLPATSCLGAFWTPAATARGRVRHAGVQKPAQFQTLTRIAAISALIEQRRLTRDLAQRSTASQCQNAFLYRASSLGLP